MGNSYTISLNSTATTRIGDSDVTFFDFILLFFGEADGSIF